MSKENLNRKDAKNWVIAAISKENKQFYVDAATDGFGTNFFRRKAKSRSLVPQWEPMVRIIADSGIVDFAPFWDKVNALIAAADEQVK